MAPAFLKTDQVSFSSSVLTWTDRRQYQVISCEPIAIDCCGDICRGWATRLFLSQNRTRQCRALRVPFDMVVLPISLNDDGHSNCNSSRHDLHYVPGVYKHSEDQERNDL